MTVGNLTALRQSSVKRMLAYSGIAHAGTILIALAAGTPAASAAAAFYLFAYAFMNIGAFAVVIVLERKGEGDVEQDRFNGIGGRFPSLAVAMAVFMLSLSGIPPLAGFFGKFLIFKAAVEADMAWLAIVGVLNSAISAYYYLRVVAAMYFKEAEGEIACNCGPAINLSLAVTTIAVVVIGLQPGLWAELLRGL